MQPSARGRRTSRYAELLLLPAVPIARLDAGADHSKTRTLLRYTTASAWPRTRGHYSLRLRGCNWLPLADATNRPSTCRKLGDENAEAAAQLA